MRPFDPALLRALPATRGPVALLSAVGILSGAVAIAQAVVLALTVLQVVRGGPLGPVLGWLVGLLVVRGALAGVSEYVARRAGLRVAAVVRLAALRHWLGQPVESRPSDEVAVTRATEAVSAVEPYVARYLPSLVSAAVVPALAILALLWIDPWSALIVVLTLPLLPVFAALIGMHTRDETEQRWGAMALLAGHFLDVVRGLPTLVNYGRAKAQVTVVREVGERHRTATVKTLRTAFMSTAALELLATISVAMVAVAVGLRLAYGQLDLGVGLMAIMLAPEAYWPVRRVGQEFHNAADGAAALESLAEDGVLGGHGDEDAAPSRPDAQDVADNSHRTRAVSPESATERATELASDAGRAIALRDVSYAHPGRERTIVDISLASPAGPGLTALVGRSGAGKTTALELLAGLRTPSAGEVEAPRAHLAAQRPVILPGTVRDNLLLVADHPDAALVAALEQVGLWDALDHRDGLDTVLGDDGFGLSAGQRARLALARAVLSDTPLILLDEPTANVAAPSVPTLHTVILGIARERHVVAVTHDPALAELADQVWELEPAPRPEPVCRTTHPAETTSVQSAGSASVGNDAEVPVPGQVEPLPTPGGRHGLALACLLGGAAVSCGVALTATSGWLIVQSSTMPVILTLLVAIVGVRAFGLFRPVFRYAERVVSHDVALEELAERRAEVFGRLIPLTPARLGRRSRGEVLTTVVRDLDDVIDEQVRVTVPGWSAAIASAVGAVIAAWHLPLAGGVVAVGALLVLGLAVLCFTLERGAQQEAVAARGRVQREVTGVAGRLLAVQSVIGMGGSADRASGGPSGEHGARSVGDLSDMTDVRSGMGEREREWGRERGRERDQGRERDRLVEGVRVAEEEQLVTEERLIRARAVGIALAWIVVAATSAVVAWLAWQAHAAGDLSGPYAALVALVPMALADTWVGVADIAGARARARAAAKRLEQVLGQQPAVADTGDLPLPRGHAPELTLDRVSASWTGGDRHTRDLRELDLHLAAGDRLALTGPNGSGKSTALAVLARHLDPTSGQYAVDGTDALALDLDTVRARIAVVDDEPHAFAGSVRANLALARPDASDDEMLAALEGVDLGWWFGTLPEGLDTLLTGLSGGERARLALARAMLSERPVVLLDEPAAHLDDATAERAIGGLLAAGGERAFVLVSHRPDDLAGWTTVELAAAPVEAEAVHP
ncbi:ATP-binding cassette domain-containing protein [Ornithinimicrobium sp. Y1694]|uniref:ATP-binding cassette domain-containing protein n=1 Tax=Ornithinimicrobium sp. Y1694 TaxID=3418590 RepID=UPI003CE9B6BA